MNQAGSNSFNKYFFHFQFIKCICLQKTFNNPPIKACFSNKNYTVSIQTRLTQMEISIFLITKKVFTSIFRLIVIDIQNIRIV